MLNTAVHNCDDAKKKRIESLSLSLLINKQESETIKHWYLIREVVNLLLNHVVTK